MELNLVGPTQWRYPLAREHELALVNASRRPLLLGSFDRTASKEERRRRIRSRARIARLRQNARERLILQFAPKIQATAHKLQTHQRNAGLAIDRTEDIIGFAVLAFLEAVTEFDAQKYSSLAQMLEATHVMTTAVRREKASTLALSVPDRALKRYYSIVSQVASATADEFACAPDGLTAGADGPVRSRPALRHDHAGHCFATGDAPADPAQRSWRELMTAAARHEMGPENLLALEQAVRGRVTLGSIEDEVRETESLNAIELREMSSAALSVLEGDELAVIRHSFGFSEDALTDEQIRQRLDLSSRVKVVRLRARALGRMRAALLGDESTPSIATWR